MPLLQAYARTVCVPQKTFSSSRKISSIVVMWYCLQGYTMVTL